MNKVENFFKQSMNINNAFNSANKNINGSFGVLQFMKRNISYFVLVIFVILIIFYAIYIVKENINSPIAKEIKSDYNIYRVDDDIIHQPVNNNQLECPRDINKYSFTFFLELDDFYCQTGFWKAIMVKGQELKGVTTRCSGHSLNKENKNYNIDKEIKMYLDDDDKIDLSKNSDLDKRVQLVCKTFEKNQLDKVCEYISVGEYNFLNNDNKIDITYGQCINFFNEHKDYCNYIYKTDQKVMRNRDNNDTNMNQEQKFDNYDNICSQDNLMEKYPELIPRNLESLKDIKLINLAEQMDTKNGEDREDRTFEGCYDFTEEEELSPGETNYFDESNSNTLEDCNRESLGKSNYFGFSNNKCYTLKMEKEEEFFEKANKNENCTKRQNDNSNSIYISKSLRPEENILLRCWEDLINMYPIQNPGVWLHPFTNTLRIIVTTQNNNTETEYDKYVNENIHPYKNNFIKLQNYNIEEHTEKTVEEIRILIQEHNEKLANFDKKIEEIQTEIKKDNGENINSLAKELQEIVKEKDEEIKSFKQQNSEYEGEINKCNQHNSKDSTMRYYREYFDVKNIPIKDKFHLSIVMNGKLVEIYLNGYLHISRILFGYPKYNSGPLHISPGKKTEKERLKLHGIISDFKYFSRAINFNNIRNIIKDKSIIETGKSVILPEEHSHKVEIAHEHPHDVINESEHIHSVDENNIKNDFYLEE